MLHIANFNILTMFFRSPSDFVPVSFGYIGADSKVLVQQVKKLAPNAAEPNKCGRKYESKC